MEKAIARRLTRDRYRIVCPWCSKRHVVSQVLNDTWVLNGDPMDTFKIQPDVDPWLYPEFVCLNPVCNFVGTAVFEVSK